MTAKSPNSFLKQFLSYLPGFLGKSGGHVGSEPQSDWNFFLCSACASSTE